MDRNAILQGYMDSYSSYSYSDSRNTVEKVLKYSGNDFDIRERSDVRTEVVVFRLLGGNTNYLLDDEKPDELDQNVEVKIYLEQSDSFSVKEQRYDRMLELSDQVMDWANATSGSAITSDVWTITLTGVTPVNEEQGYLVTEVNFKSTISI